MSKLFRERTNIATLARNIGMYFLVLWSSLEVYLNFMRHYLFCWWETDESKKAWSLATQIWINIRFQHNKSRWLFPADSRYFHINHSCIQPTSEHEWKIIFALILNVQQKLTEKVIWSYKILINRFKINLVNYKLYYEFLALINF